MSEGDSNKSVENEEGFTVVVRKKLRQKNNPVIQSQMTATEGDERVFDKCRKDLQLLLRNLDLGKSKINFEKSNQFNRFLQNNPRKDELIQIFKLFKIVLEKLYENKEYDLVLHIQDNFIKNINQNNFDLNVLQMHRIVAQVRNAKANYKNALEILENIREIVLPTEELSFLISSDIAYTKHLMGKHKESYEECKSLYYNMLNHIGLHAGEDIKCPEMSTETYNLVLQSPKYSRILQFNTEHLNLLQVQGTIAYELICLGSEYSKITSRKQQYSEAKYNEAVLSFNEALSIFLNISNKKQNDILFYNNKRQIARIYNALGYLKLQKFVNTTNLKEDLNDSNKTINTSNLNEALIDCQKALKIYNELLKIQNEKHLKISPAKIKIEQDISSIYDNIARIHTTFGKITFQERNDEALHHFQIALENYKNICKFYKEVYSDKHEYVSKAMYDIAHINNKLGELQSHDNPLKAIKYYTEALENYEKVYKFNREEHNDEHEHIFKAMHNIAHTNNKLGELQLHNNPLKALQHFQEALENYENVYNFYREKYNDEHEYVFKAMHVIAQTYNKLGELQSHNRPLEAIQYFTEALERYKKVYKFYREKYSEEHEYVFKPMKNIAEINNQLGELQSHDNPLEAIQYYTEALGNFEKVYKFYRVKYNDEHEYFLSTMVAIAFINIKLGQLKSHDSSLERIQYFKNAYEINVELYEKQCRLFGEMDSKTKKTKIMLKYAKSEMKKKV